MARYDIYMDQLNDNGDEIKNIAEKKIDPNIKEITRIANELKWEGPSYDMFINTFNKKMETVRQIPLVVGAYGNFMKKASGGYQDLSDKMYDELQNDKEEHERQRKANKYR